MPSLLTSDKEVRDVAAYLLQLIQKQSDPKAIAKNQDISSKGKAIFESIGCINCHDNKEHSIASVGIKFRSQRALKEFLLNPLQTHPGGRMPQMFDAKTQKLEADYVAHYLFHSQRKKNAPIAVGKGGDVERGRMLVRSRGCISCHTVQDGDKVMQDESTPPLFTAHSTRRKVEPVRFDIDKGCLSAAPKQGTPNYQFSATDRANLQSFLKSVTEHPVVADAPVERFYRRITQFNCTACHSFNDKIKEGIKLTDDGKVITAERLPDLTGAGDKLRVDWLQQVLLQHKRTRPWLNSRMPHFGDALKDLPILFPKASGSPLIDDAPPPKMELASEGLKMIGTQSGKASCITCHDYRGINRQSEGVVPAPDMAEIGKTLRGEWFRRWMHNPTRLQPGTSMPLFFLELNNDAKKQKIDELWSALYHQAKLPLPKGLLDTQAKGTKIVVRDLPVLFRVATILPDNRKIDRAINVGLPNGTNFTFDAKTAQLRFAWQGEFIDAGPAWNGRGGQPVKASGKSLYNSPDHFPIRIGKSDSAPSVRFLGYSLVNDYPVFRYIVDGVAVRERIEIRTKELIRRYEVGKTEKKVFFVAEKGRTYLSKSGDFKNGVLTLAGEKAQSFSVRTPIRLDTKRIRSSLK